MGRRRGLLWKRRFLMKYENGEIDADGGLTFDKRISSTSIYLFFKRNIAFLFLFQCSKLLFINN